MKSPSLRFHLIFLAAVVLLAAGVRIAFSFTEPIQTPPQANVLAPINVSSVGQTKTGSLVVNGFSVSGSGSVLTIPNGNVAIGKTIAGYALDVTGRIQATGDICTDLAGGKCLSAVAGAAGLWAANGANISNTNSGNVGIGITNPGAKLEIGGNPNDAIRTAYLNISANNTSVTDRPYFRGVADHLVIAPRTTGNSTMYYSYPGDMVSGTTVDTRIQETLFIDRTGSGGGGNIGIKAGSTLYLGREESFGGTDTGGSDYGYIRWDNDNNTYNFWGDSGENGALIIGSENDGQNQHSDVVVLKSSAGVMIDSGLGRFTGTAEAGYLVLRATDETNEGGELRLDGAANDANPNHPSIHLDNFAGNARIHTLAAGKRFEVLGGDGIRVQGLGNCDTIDTDASGNFRCGSDASGTGGIAAETDPVWVGWRDSATRSRLGGDLGVDKLVIAAGDGEIYRSGGQVVYEADDNWFWFSPPGWHNHNEMELNYTSGLYVRHGLRVGALANCNTIDTDASGNFSCGTDATGTGGITAETDPTVPAAIKDGIGWGEISGIPAGFADGVDNTSSASQTCSWNGTTYSQNAAACNGNAKFTCTNGVWENLSTFNQQCADGALAQFPPNPPLGNAWFGGMYSISSARYDGGERGPTCPLGSVSNPITNNCACPSGFSVTQITNAFTGYTFFCWKR